MNTSDPQREPRSTDADNSGAPSKQSPVTMFLHHTVTAILVLALLGTVIWLYLRTGNAPGGEAASRSPESQVRPLQAAESARSRTRVTDALEVGRLVEGAYPDDLKFLVRKGLLVRKDLYYASGDSKFDYRRTGDGYQLQLKSPSSAGASDVSRSDAQTEP